MSQKKQHLTVSFLFGMMGIVLCLSIALLCCIHSSALFKWAELHYAPYQHVGLTESEAAEFAIHTIGFLNRKMNSWTPSLPFSVPQGFVVHMNEIKEAVQITDFGVGTLLLVYLIWMYFALFCTECFQRRFFIVGLCTAIVLLLLILLWALIDFPGFWLILHKYLIPNGIFSASEPIMSLFPVTLFRGYLPSFFLFFLISVCLLIGLPLWLAYCVLQRRNNNVLC